MTVVQIFDAGNVFTPDVLDIDEKVLIDRFMSGITTIASISLALHYPTLVSIMHSVVNSYKNLLAVSVATDYTFEAAQKVKDYLENPDAFASAAPAAAAATESAAAPAAAEEKEEEKEVSRIHCSHTYMSVYSCLLSDPGVRRRYGIRSFRLSVSCKGQIANAKRLSKVGSACVVRYIDVVSSMLRLSGVLAIQHPLLSTPTSFSDGLEHL